MTQVRPECKYLSINITLISFMIHWIWIPNVKIFIWMTYNMHGPIVCQPLAYSLLTLNMICL